MEALKQKLRRSVLYLLGFSAFPLLTSCYGTPQNYQEDYDRGKVTDAEMQPIKGIKVTYKGVDNNRTYTIYTDEDGNFDIYEPLRKGRVITFEDVDGSSHGGQFSTQTYLTTGSERYLTISLDLEK